MQSSTVEVGGEKDDDAGDEIVQDEDELVQDWMLLPKASNMGKWSCSKASNPDTS